MTGTKVAVGTGVAVVEFVIIGANVDIGVGVTINDIGLGIGVELTTGTIEVAGLENTPAAHKTSKSIATATVPIGNIYFISLLTYNGYR